ncbi:MAG: hypothetical protein P9L92_09045 [Candidatus Electryonea clarkiae]|nr:hypothetical protein [Candidatus Electryonea clarkiae]MDP8288694.1 hypothetical protein [Candidatus Electryonea clarkiae]
MRVKLLKIRHGSIMINTLIIVFFLIATGTAFMMWAVDESYQADFDLARTQAYYVAQYGILSQVLKTMRTRTQNALPAGYERLTDGTWNLEASSESIGSFVDAGIRRVDSNQDVNIFQTINQYDLEASGRVAVGGPFGQVTTIEREVSMRTQLRTYASYMYLTNEETTMFNEIIWFWTPDTLYGRVHSNSQIGIKFAPQFLGPISTTEDRFVYFSANPYFAFDPVFNAPHVYFPSTAENLRGGAASGGTFFTNQDGAVQSRLRGLNGGWFLEQWSAGIPYDSSRIDNSVSISYGSNVAIFIEGNCQLAASMGQHPTGFGGINGVIHGSVTVGTSGDLELWDNVIYSSYNANTIPDTFPSEYGDICGLVSEGRILIKDVDPNGRGDGRSQPGGHNRQHIVITAAMVALGESFTFEHQNDSWNTYVWCTCPGEHCGQSDERGSIWLRGAVTQMRRGYVHRSNCGGSGYAKDYYYDFRLETTPPPFYLEATDDEGASLFDIVWWKEHDPHDGRP